MATASTEPEFELSTQSARREEEKELNLYFLSIEILNAKDLIKADIGIGVSSDPFVTVTANGQTYTTKTVMNNLNPEFNEKTSFCFFQHVSELTFQVLDWDKNTKHDEIGKCTLDVSKFFEPNHPGFNGTLKLQEVKSGSINVVVKGRLVRPIELENRCVEMSKVKDANNKVIDQNAAEIDKISKEISELQETQTKLKGEQVSLELTVSQFEDVKSELQSSIEKIKNDITQSKNNAQTLRKQIEEKKTEITNIEKETKAQESEYTAQRTKKENILEEMESLRRQLMN